MYAVYRVLYVFIAFQQNLCFVLWLALKYLQNLVWHWKMYKEKYLLLPFCCVYWYLRNSQHYQLGLFIKYFFILIVKPLIVETCVARREMCYFAGCNLLSGYCKICIMTLNPYQVTSVFIFCDLYYFQMQ